MGRCEYGYVSNAVMPKREKIEFKYHDGSLIPAHNYARSLLQQRNFKDGQVVRAELSKLRSNGLNKHAHNIGNLCIHQIDDFREYEGRVHDALKRLQLESGAECDEVAIKPSGLCSVIPGAVIKTLRPVLELFGMSITDDGLLIVRVPRSLSFENMGEERFHDALKVICRHICDVYWPTCTPEQVELMAEQNAMVNE